MILEGAEKGEKAIVCSSACANLLADSIETLSGLRPRGVPTGISIDLNSCLRFELQLATYVLYIGDTRPVQ